MTQPARRAGIVADAATQGQTCHGTRGAEDERDDGDAADTAGGGQPGLGNPGLGNPDIGLGKPGLGKRGLRERGLG